jgi:small subunit ribosomal protein S13
MLNIPALACGANMAEAKDNKESKESKPQQERKASTPAVSSIVRIAGKDVNGALSVERALHNVKGIGSNMSQVLSIIIEAKLGIKRSTNIGSLDEEQVAKVEQVIKSPEQYGVPNFMLNRNKNMETGLTIHNTGNELLFATRQDVNRDISMKVWRGLRHQYGQRVRGQHTRSTGRTGVTVGVTKKAVKDAQKASRATEKKPAAGGAAAPAAEAKK